MSGRQRISTLGAIVAGLVVMIGGAGIALVAYRLVNVPDIKPYDYWIEGLVNAVPFGVVALTLLVKRPDNVITWLFAGLSLAGSAQLFLGEYSTISIRAELGWPGDVWAAWGSEIAQTSLVMLLMVIIFLFPTGATPSPRWRPALFLLVFASIAQVLYSALDPRLDLAPGIANPLGLDPESAAMGALDQIAGIGAALGLTAAVLALIVRWYRSTGIERQQLKWFMFATVIAALVLFGSGLVAPGWTEGTAGTILWALAPASIGTTAALAILRYRLYDIDVVINKTMVYLLLSSLLALVYLGGVALVRSLIPLAGDSQLAVAASTLAVAGLFQPLRRRIQGFIDHYFYRRKYDAQRTIADFSSRLRDEIDLAALEAELVGVVSETMQPRDVSVWLMPEQVR